MSYNKQLNLLDSDIHSYVIKWYRGLLAGVPIVFEIQKENGEKIGVIQPNVGKRFFEKSKTNLLDVENSVLLTLIRSEGFLGAEYRVVDSDNNLIGTVDRKRIMKNSKGDKILTCKSIGPPFPSKNKYYLMEEGEFGINSTDGNNIAKISIKADEVKKSFWKPRYYLTCILQVNDLNFDRKTLFGMFIATLQERLEYPQSAGR